jgi:tRNA 2-selenouridine synthase
MNKYNKISAQEFLRLSAEIPVVDVRSPSEFTYGHIPGAYNIPLFNDEERAAVGTSYKKEGRSSAILKGLQLTGPTMNSKLQEALKLSLNGKLLVHCWRGGMRSEAMSWLFSLGDIETWVLEGGYKAYRQYILDRLSQKRKYIVLGGLTGSGKTEILKRLQSLGHNVIDLEGIACHKGSAFGSLGQPAQPSSEHFANLLFTELEKINPSDTIWLEDESKNIGTVFMPDQFFNNLREAPVVALIMDVYTRMPRLLKEYSEYSRDQLIQSVKRISKRLGGDNTTEAIAGIEASDFSRAIEITLGYYDKTYMYGIRKRANERVRYIETDTDNIEINTDRILKAASEFL